jgi:hypothetical protein
MGSQRGSASVTPSQKNRAVSGFGKGIGKKINLSSLASRSSSGKKSGSSKSKQRK